MLNEIHEDNELRKESTSLEKQIDQLRSVIWTLEEDQVTVIQASADLDDQLNSIIETSRVIEWTLDDTRGLLEKLEGMKFTVQLDVENPLEIAPPPFLLSSKNEKRTEERSDLRSTRYIVKQVLHPCLLKI